jgi:hypothetical protein
MTKLVCESLDKVMSFERSSNPLKNLNIGHKARIEQWLEKMGVVNYYLTKDFKINVIGSVHLYDNNLIELPSYIQFNQTCSFYIDSNELTTLRGCPSYVEGNFDCSYNNLISLDFCPDEVTGDFDCNNNSKKFTKDYVMMKCKVGETIRV